MKILNFIANRLTEIVFVSIFAAISSLITFGLGKIIGIEIDFLVVFLTLAPVFNLINWSFSYFSHFVARELNFSAKKKTHGKDS